MPDYLDRLPRGRFSPWPEMRLFGTVLRAGLRHRALLLFSSRGHLKPELLAITLFRLLPRTRRPVVVVYGEMFERTPGWRGAVEGFVMSLVKDGVARFVLFSDAERDIFCREWGVPERLTATCRAFLPDTVSEGEDGDDAVEGLRLPQGPYVFSGGQAFRDFAPLVEAARRAPDVPFVICAGRDSLPADLPSNVWVGGLEQPVYRYLLKRAAAVVVPLKVGTGRVAGMFTYLRAMQLGKPTIISRALAVDEYVDDGINALVVEPDADAYLRAIGWVLDPNNAVAVADMCSKASEHVESRYTLQPYVTTLLQILDEVDGYGATGDEWLDWMRST